MSRGSRKKVRRWKTTAATPLPPPVSCPPGSASARTGASERWAVLGVCVFLAVIVWIVFGQTLHHGFVSYDDDDYVYENSVVQKGLTWGGMGWAFAQFHSANWHPLTWLSHMLDCQLYGLNAGGHHFTNVALHTLSAVLLFLVLRRMTGALWRSAFVAAVFAIHPLHVESVAWVAERKDVLSGVFFMLTIMAYVRYAGGARSPVRYGLVLLLFALGLMCKPMLVTLPFVLLLLDYWPLRRMSGAMPLGPGWKRPLIEKIPFFVLAAASCVVTIFAQTGAIQAVEGLPLAARLENALESYVVYLGQMFWPLHLAVLYPFAAGNIGVSALSLLLLAGISAAAFGLRRRCPYFLTGWLWYLVMLLPVIGILQVGLQAHADRYTYLPQIGLYLALTWGAVDWCAGWRYRRAVLGGVSAAVLVALIFCARLQAACWRNSESLWTHTLACTVNNYDAQYNLGVVLLKQGAVDDAIACFREALRINPHYAEADNNLGYALFQKGAVDGAIIRFQQALQVKPGLAIAHYNLANALLQKGAVDDAVAQFQQALQINPAYTDARINLGNALLQKGAVDDAIAQFQQALQINPGFAEAHNNLGNALLQKGAVDDAIAQFQQALQINPRYAEARYNLGNALFRAGNVDAAILQYQQALQIKPVYAEAHNNLGYALLQKGDDAGAIFHYQQALQINPAYANAKNNLAWVLATSSQAALRNGGKAVELARQANQFAGDGNPIFLATLAAAYAETGQFPEAVNTAQRALRLAETNANTGLIQAIQSQLKSYQANVPYRAR